MKKLAACDFEDLLQVEQSLNYYYSSYLIFNNLIKCSMPVFEHLLPEPHNTLLQKLLHRMAEWHSFAKLRLHSESTLSYLEILTRDLGKQMREFRDKTCSHFETFELPREVEARNRRQQSKAQGKQPEGGSGGKKLKTLNLLIYKWHALGDYVQTIRLFGGTDGYSTQLVSSRLVYPFNNLNPIY